MPASGNVYDDPQLGPQCARERVLMMFSTPGSTRAPRSVSDKRFMSVLARRIKVLGMIHAVAGESTIIESNSVAAGVS